MTHYSNDPSMVKVEFFKTTGKWYSTETIKWDRYNISGSDGSYEDPNETFKRCLKEQLKGRLKDMIAICCDPYSDCSFPLMVFPEEYCVLKRRELEHKLEPFAKGCFSGTVSEWPQLKPLLRELYEWIRNF